MKTFQDFQPPSTADLERLKRDLGLTGAQMADLAVLGGSHQWRKYTGGSSPRPMSPHMLFLLAARLELSEDDLERVLARMRQIGARFSFDDPPQFAAEAPEHVAMNDAAAAALMTRARAAR